MKKLIYCKSTFEKSKAKKEAEKLRDNGYNARVVPSRAKGTKIYRVFRSPIKVS
jgi:hypothetical protein